MSSEIETITAMIADLDRITGQMRELSVNEHVALLHRAILKRLSVTMFSTQQEVTMMKRHMTMPMVDQNGLIHVNNVLVGRWRPCRAEEGGGFHAWSEAVEPDTNTPLADVFAPTATQAARDLHAKLTTRWDVIDG
jgi:hypothetical protein